MDCVFVGAGAVAGAYAKDLQDSILDLQAVCDPRVDRAEALASEHDAEAYAELDRMLDAESAPLVVNLTSHGAHADVTRRSLVTDRHVFSEKPLALKESDARELIELAERQGRGLDVAPINHRGPLQTHASRFVADGRLGDIRVGYAHAHVGRVTEWHENPESFLSVGPLYDGAVYPLTLLVSWFGPVERVRTADAIDAWPDREETRPERPAHVEAHLEFSGGLVVRLTASFYVPHRSREFYSLELHGDDGSLYLPDSGALEAGSESVQVAGSGREYVEAPYPGPSRALRYLDGPEALVQAVRNGSSVAAGARRGGHVVAVCNAIETAAAEGRPVAVDDFGLTVDPPTSPVVRPDGAKEWGGSQTCDARTSAITLPSIGFGCSRYRDGEYVDRIDSIATALDAGYRLFDSAELYGNEERVGRLLASPGTPDREGYFLVGKVWNTNHEHVAEACAGSLDALGVDAFDCYMLHWPDSWAYQGPLQNLAERDPETQEALTFPTDDSGDPIQTDVPLQATWKRLEGLYDSGLTRTLGISNIETTHLESILESARIPPAIVQIESHPYQPRQPLVDACHERGIRVMAHSPLSAPGILDEEILREIAGSHGVSPAAVVLAWNVQRGVVPIPSSNDRDHIVENLAAAKLRLTEQEMDRIDTLADPAFER